MVKTTEKKVTKKTTAIKGKETKNKSAENNVVENETIEDDVIENETNKENMVENETVESIQDDSDKVIQKNIIPEVVNEPRKFLEEEGIICRSNCVGELRLKGKKSRNMYIWGGYDDTCEVEVRDLNAAKAAKASYIYLPNIIVEDDDFINQPKWTDVRSIYDEIKNNDINELFKLTPKQFRIQLMQLSKGYQDIISAAAATKIRNGELDSINMIKAIDEICGTDLFCLVG